MGCIPRWLRLALCRGMNKGNCSFFKFACSHWQAARFSLFPLVQVHPAGNGKARPSRDTSHRLNVEGKMV
jgi:hypothetical protein